MITVVQATTPKEMLSFVKFPFQLYAHNPHWVPPLIQEELDSFNPQINPVFDQAEAHFYLAYKQNELVGRMAAIINWEEVNHQNKRKVRFGWWDVIDDVEVTEALLKKVYELGKKNQLDHVEGPMGFSNLDKVGVITEGFDFIGSMITWYNYPYYASHLEKLGFVTEKEYIESEFSFTNVNPELFEKAATLISQRYQLKSLSFTKTKDLMPYVDEMFDLFNTSYAKLASFVALNERQKAYFKKKYISFINPEYIKFVVDAHGKLIAFGIVMPSFSQALQKTKGKLFPFGFYHLLRAKKHSKDVLFYLIGIDPEYQNKGVTALIFKEYYTVFKEKNIQKCIRTPELVDNLAIQNLWKNFSPKVTRRRKTFLKKLTS
jgi:GNAT superfamily N-acetyltransferase